MKKHTHKHHPNSPVASHPITLDAVLAELRALRSVVEARLPAPMQNGLVDTREAMRVMGYKSAKRLIEAAKKSKVFYVELSARRYGWNPAELKLWKERKGRGIQRAK